MVADWKWNGKTRTTDQSNKSDTSDHSDRVTDQEEAVVVVTLVDMAGDYA